jgi:hypothetical protein
LLDMPLPLPTWPCSLRSTVPSLSLITTPNVAVPPGLTGRKLHRTTHGIHSSGREEGGGRAEMGGG